METTRAPFTILLAEDNPGDVFLVRRALEKHALDFHLVIVEDGKAALEFVDAADVDQQVPCPDLVLLDLNLPRANGSRVLARIKQSLRCGSTPIIVITSSDSPMDRENAAQLGADGFFQKPGDLESFMQLGRIVRDTLLKAPLVRQTQSGG